jgi:hypothetical protein
VLADRACTSSDIEERLGERSWDTGGIPGQPGEGDVGIGDAREDQCLPIRAREATWSGWRHGNAPGGLPIPDGEIAPAAHGPAYRLFVGGLRVVATSVEAGIDSGRVRRTRDGFRGQRGAQPGFFERADEVATTVNARACGNEVRAISERCGNRHGHQQQRDPCCDAQSTQ